MPWVKIDIDLLGHFKTKKVAALLGLPPVYVAGHLQALWGNALRYRPDGDLTDLEEDGIASCAEWTGDPHVFVEALVGVRFLEQTRDGRILIHDWEQYSGQYLQQKEATRKRVAEWRDKKRQEREEQVVPPRPEPPQPTTKAKIGAPQENPSGPCAVPADGPVQPVLAGFAVTPAGEAVEKTRRRRKGFATEPYWRAAEEGMGRKRPTNERGLDDWNKVLMDFERAGEKPEIITWAMWHYRKTCPGYRLSIEAATRDSWVADAKCKGNPGNPDNVPSQNKDGVKNGQAATTAARPLSESERRTQEAARRIIAQRKQVAAG